MEPTAMEAIKTAFTSAITGLQTDVLGYVAVVVPVALGIVGVFLAVKYGMRFFKSVSK